MLSLICNSHKNVDTKKFVLKKKVIDKDVRQVVNEAIITYFEPITYLSVILFYFQKYAQKNQ